MNIMRKTLQGKRRRMKGKGEFYNGAKNPILL